MRLFLDFGAVENEEHAFPVINDSPDLPCHHFEGSIEDCSKKDPCCDPITCRLRMEANCSAGACCENCKVCGSTRAGLRDCTGFLVQFHSITKSQFVESFLYLHSEKLEISDLGVLPFALQLKPAGHLCRQPESECDFPEFCDGRTGEVGLLIG